MTSAALGFAEGASSQLSAARELWDLSLEAWLLLGGLLIVLLAILFLTDVVLPGHARSRERRPQEASPRMLAGKNKGEALLEQSLALGQEARQQELGAPSLEQIYRNPHISIAPRGVQRADSEDVDVLR